MGYDPLQTPRVNEGLELRAIWWPDVGNGEVGIDTAKVGGTIHIVNVPGQMGNVPWALYVSAEGTEYYYNLALIEGFSIKEVEDGDCH